MKGGTTTVGGGLGSSTMMALSTPDESPINLLLFGMQKKGGYGGMTSSLGNTSISSNSQSSFSVIQPLKMIIRTSQLTTFNISSSSQTQEKPINLEDDPTEAKSGLETKIKTLLEQRKPPTEAMISLNDMYDDDLNYIGP